MEHETHLSLHDDFLIPQVLRWHHQSHPGDMALISMAPRTMLRLLWRDKQQVHWCPPGRRGVTMPLDEAVQRLRILHPG